MNRFIALPLCGGVSAALLVGALVFPGAASAQPVMSAALQEQVEFLCQRTEFTRSEINSLQRSREFALILTYTLEACPNVAGVLADGATASIGRMPRNNDNERAPSDRPSKEKESPKGI
ncbi:hypothetical protein [Defluviimonas sp. SAOS-178_SWC]|uniref:hypothetical protein n=1 Tax=Defluviimonas sp. SAOS-178_SWC TaxID=3121287 RepID=UPI0032215D89